MEYIIEIREPTNNPGSWITKLVLTDKNKAEETFNKIIEGEDVDEVPATEWDDRGPNWKNLRTVEGDDYIITLDEVDTEKALKDLLHLG